MTRSGSWRSSPLDMLLRSSKSRQIGLECIDQRSTCELIETNQDSSIDTNVRDNPKHYNDDKDAREFDPRLRGPPREAELAVDPRTGMKNYIANEQGDWATSIGYVRQSLLRSIHFGRMYTSSQKSSGSPEDLYEALRCLGQSLHCLEDFGAHTNYTELTLRQLGMNEVFPHTGLATEINLRGQRTFPLVTGTFGTVDFIHSVLGTATDHFAQTEVQQLDRALGEAQAETNRENLDGQRGFGISGTNMSSLTGLLSQIPGSGGNLCRQAEHLQFEADKQDSFNSGSQAIQERGGYQAPRASGPNFSQGGPSANIPGTNVDPVALAKKIYPILEFRDNVVRAIALTIERVPGLEKLVQKIMETLQLFILSLLAPFVRPIINAVSATLKQGSSTLVDTSAKHQFEVWTNISCSDPTHSMLSKDHFSNVLNEPAGFVAAEIVKYVAPRIVYAWEHPGVPEQEVMQDILRVFHHPVLRDQNCELHRNMFDAVQLWLSRNPDRSKLADILSSEGVRKGKNDIQSTPTFSHGSLSASNMFGFSGYTQVPAQQWHKISGRSIADGAPAGDDIGLGNAYPSGLEPGHAAMAGRQSSDFGAGSSGEVAGYCRAESEAYVSFSLSPLHHEHYAMV
jgi:hypothetical protein